MKEKIQKSFDQLLSCLVSEFHPERIILFGSRAWGQPEFDSDFDLCIIVGRSSLRPVERIKRAYRAMRNIALPVDILVKTRFEMDKFKKIPSSLEYLILEEGRKLYG